MRRKSFSLMILAGLATLLAGCATPGMKMDVSSMTPVAPEPTGPQIQPRLIPITPQLIAEQARAKTKRSRPTAETPDNSDYRIGPGDVLTVTVWDHPELTIPAGEFRSAEIAGHLVDADGAIFYPYVGILEVAGFTTGEIRKLIAERLRHYIQKPQIDVRVAAYRSKKVYVAGQVGTPNVVPINDRPLTVVEAVNLVGGTTPEADLTDVRVTRGNQVHQLDLLSIYSAGAEGNFRLRDGDQIYVPDRSDNQVYVMGEVNDPSTAAMRHGRLSLAEAISAAGGMDEDLADASQIFVIRGDIHQPSVYQLNAASADAMLLATAFPLQKHDVVYVSPTGLTRWNRVVRQILPTIQTLWQTDNLVNR
ncbi:polysaccharide export protein [Thiohalomonas denitrificans]|uniref:polysaccharide export protein n=1 Tax=Thiohalomonas denitrificans TaxID=415747 RepID=UPI0026EC5910|nr:polysaccharide export protein [Thiohalomonas denitrificans]